MASGEDQEDGSADDGEPRRGEVVLSVASPDALRREGGEIRRLIAQAGTGVEPLVVVIETAEELRDGELPLLVDAAQRSSRAVIVRIIRGG